MMTSAPAWSIHSRIFDDAMSALFWWSAKTSSIFLPGNSFCMSAIAMRIASTPPCPSMSEYSEDMSVTKPITILSPDSFCACALPTPNASPHIASAAQIFFSFTVSPPLGEALVDQTPRSSCSVASFSRSCAAAKVSTMRPCSMT